MKALCLFFLCTFTLCISAQRKGTLSKIPSLKRQVQFPDLNAEKHKQGYEFPQAIIAYQKDLTNAATRSSHDSLTLLLRQCERAEQLLANCKRVFFIDSLVFNKDSLLSLLPLSHEAGYYAPRTSLFPNFPSHSLSPQEVAYITPLRTTAYFSAPSSSDSTRLYRSFYSAGLWETPTPLEGISPHTYQFPRFPFQLTDGVTLYFSAQGPESIGGYDLFVTRYNATTHRYVHPTNLGMPFNSLANDYLLAIDSHSTLGYLLTDRQQREGEVCLYTFLLQEEYAYLPDTISRSQRISYARIDSIDFSLDDTQRQKAKASIGKAKTTPKESSQPSRFHFIVNDQQVLHQISDFPGRDLQAQAQKWFKGEQELQKLQVQHSELQKRYARDRAPMHLSSLNTYEKQMAHLRLLQQKLSQQIRKALQLHQQP